VKLLLRRFISNKKGVAEVIGSLIIILIVAIAGTVAYAYSISVMSASSSSFELRTEKYQDQLQERFQIIRVWSNNQDLINITVHNYGKTDLTIIALYLNGTAIEDYLSGLDSTIGTGQLLNVRFKTPFQIDSDSSLEILAISQRGGKTSVLYEN